MDADDHRREVRRGEVLYRRRDIQLGDEKIQLAIEGNPVRDTVKKALEQLGAQRKVGRAPRGAQERIVQQWLDSQ